MEQTYKKIELIYLDGNTPDNKHTNAPATMLEYLFNRLTNLPTDNNTAKLVVYLLTPPPSVMTRGTFPIYI